MNKRMGGVVLAMMFFCAACGLMSRTTSVIPATAPQVATVARPAISPSATRSPTLLALARTATAIPTIVITSMLGPTSPPTSTVRSQCLSVESQLPKDLGIDGKLVLYGKDESILPDGKEEVYLFDLKTREKSLLSPGANGIIKAYDLLAVSPDGKWFAYNETFRDPFKDLSSKWVHLRIMAADGRQVPLLDQPKEWGQIIGWLDNERLALTSWDKCREPNRMVE